MTVQGMTMTKVSAGALTWASSTDERIIGEVYSIPTFSSEMSLYGQAVTILIDWK